MRNNEAICTQCLRAVSACHCQLEYASGEVGVRVLRICLSNRVLTRVMGLKVDGQVLGQIARQLKVACRTSSVVRDGWIDLQGDHVECVTEWLHAQGWQVPMVTEIARDFADMRGVRWG